MDDSEFWRIVGLFDWQKIGNDEAVLKPAVNWSIAHVPPTLRRRRRQIQALGRKEYLVPSDHISASHKMAFP